MDKVNFLFGSPKRKKDNMVPFNPPVEVLEEIFSFLDPKCLITKCRPVCRLWKEVIDEIVLPRRAVKSVQMREALREKNLNVRVYYDLIVNLKKNLLRNVLFELAPTNMASAFIQSLNPTFVRDSNVPHWVTRGPYQREKPSIGANPEFISWSDLKENGIQDAKNCPVVATSHSMTSQYQDIILSECNISDELMDVIKPTIVAEEWIGTRWDCGNEYSLVLELFCHNSDTSDYRKICQVGTHGGGPGSWRKVSISIKNYDRGVRRIRFTRYGKDSQFWAGFYGTKFALPKVYLELPKFQISLVEDSKESNDNY
ncbi:F-box only protein 6-like [Neocloeon triangulifer]|uniref:F-box only protein 6-like n=1 Tax=Neocloeon triangulifer TaxID=2078957 RepID=UPI00286F7DFB|nr:F-box only protein 6-like [Neocloeon triangulifer]